ncbi:hypothetical protein JWJ90_13230 [Desulfobulbus rhabdoformis]|uniref:hypothetical protein n=1 Tax=Desulfobulbus rhabdoformis TaxID=34032 RepID=UPI0019651288|nr:hypothetical protein [Desulfobulbus rhabdoformis]MBM9615242.1 hypothetical protein [Desulfobulbus rhabdoformis]
MTSKDLQQTFYRFFNQRYEMVLPNVYMGNSGNEMDLAALRKSGLLEEVEIKISKSDFIADFKKTNPRGQSKHELIQSGKLACNYFSFLIPEVLASSCDVPEYAGLYICKEWRGRLIVIERQKPKILHKRKIETEVKYQLARKMVFRWWSN